MPKHFEFVLAAYGIWLVTFVVYLAYLQRRAAATRRALARMSSAHPTDS